MMRTTALSVTALLLLAPAAAAAGDAVVVTPPARSADQVLCQTFAEKVARQSAEQEPQAVFARELASCLAQFRRSQDLRPGARQRIPGVRDLVPLR